MATLKITRSEAVKYFSKEEQSLYQKMSKKNGELSDSDLTYSVSYAVKVKALSFQDLLSGKAQEKGEFNPLDYMFSSLTIHCRKKKMEHKGEVSEKQFQFLISKIKKMIKKQEQEESKEQARFNSLSTEDQQKEIDELVEKLRRPGFMAINRR